MATGGGEAIWGAECGSTPLPQSRLAALYRELEAGDARALAERALAALAHDDEPFSRPAELLHRLSCFVPEAFAGLHARVLEVAVTRPRPSTVQTMPRLAFRTADPASRDRLLDLVEATDGPVRP